jgi:hypothetical protein
MFANQATLDCRFVASRHTCYMIIGFGGYLPPGRWSDVAVSGGYLSPVGHSLDRLNRFEVRENDKSARHKLLMRDNSLSGKV